jgi:hypothetical protein
MRVVDTPDALGALDGSNVVEFLDGSVEWQMRFGSEADGDPIVDVYSDAVGDFVEYTLQGEGSGYHLYELVFDPSTHTTDLFVDGVERMSDLTGRSHISIGWVYWGNRSTVDTGHANYEVVRFELFGADVPAVPPWAIVLVAVLLVVGGHVLTRRISADLSR